jgi:RNA polymerase sigma factor (sigma-70 family)
VDSRPSGIATRYLSALFQVGTAAGLSDRVLLERFAERQDASDAAAEVAFAALVERHGPMVLRVCRAVLGDRHEAEDAFQATFLVLAGRARSIRRGDSVGPWLHGAALRVANRARWRAARRRHHERRHAEMNASTGAGESRSDHRSIDDVDRVLHEEIGRLPEKYRRPVVLCYLEGLTHDQAADRLDWPVGTVRRRLAGARDRLRGRLSRRGITPSLVPAGLLGSMPASESAWAAISVPSRLAEVTVCGALRVGLGKKAALAGIVSAEAIALMKGVSQTMTTTKLIAMTAALLTAGLVTTGIGLLAYPGQPRGAQAALAQARQSQPPKAEEKPRPPEADSRSPDDQLDALLLQHDEVVESSRRTNRSEMRPDEKKTQIRANAGKLQDIITRMLELATRHPRTSAAERALIWIITSHTITPETNKAWELLARDHIRSDRIKLVLSRQRVQILWASQAVENLLRNALEQNPYREIRGLACYWLAEVLRFRAENLRIWPLLSPERVAMFRERFFDPRDIERVLKQDPRALEYQAKRLYDRVITEFPSVESNDAYHRQAPLVLGKLALFLATTAKVHLDELDRLSVGRVAPEIEGTDLDSRPMKLSDFRGKVAVLFMNGGPFMPAQSFGLSHPPRNGLAFNLANYNGLARMTEGKPVVLLGVIADDRDECKKRVQASGLPIRFWWDPDRPAQPERPDDMVWGPRPGPIRTAWADETPNVYVIDAKGVIRYTQAASPDILEKAVATVLKEQERSPDPTK